jgi:hypothetical protein
MRADKELAVVPGGLIQRTIVRDTRPTEFWDLDNITMFNLRLFDASTFQALGSELMRYTYH